MDLFQFVVAVLTIAAPLVGAVGYWIKRSSDARLDTVRMEMERLKTDAAQTLAASKSIEALTNAIITQVDERRETTAAIKEFTVASQANTTALNTVGSRLEDWEKRQGDIFAGFTTQITSAMQQFQLVVTDVSLSIKSSVDGILPQLFTQVSPLVTRIEMLVREVQDARDENNKQREEKLDSLIDVLSSTSDVLKSQLARYEQIIARAIQIEAEEKDHGSQNWAAVSTNSNSAGGDASDGTGFHEPQPAGA